MPVNSEANVIEFIPNVRGAMRHDAVSPHRFKGVQRLDFPENLPEKSVQEQTLRELLDDSHRRIRLLEAQIKRMRIALIEATIGGED